MLVEQKAIIKPKGKAKTNVHTNSRHVSLKPSNKSNVTCQKVIFIIFGQKNL